MNRELGLKILSQIMGWDKEDSDEARLEFDWLIFMSVYKYDGYQDYLAGVRFIESLCKWLQQFNEGEDRKIAYRYVKEKLIYFSPEEIYRLVEKFYPETVQRELVAVVARQLSIQPYEVWSSKQAIEQYNWEKRKTLFMGLSDGARLDILRRANAGIISNEQVVITTQIDQTKWRSLLNDLRKELKSIKGNVDTSQERFSRVYLLDDIMASGTSFLREQKDPSKGTIDGRLSKFFQSVEDATNALSDCPFESGFAVNAHHYIGTDYAQSRVSSLYEKTKDHILKKGVGKFELSFGMNLPDSIRLGPTTNDEFVRLCKEYYNPLIEGKGEHGGQSGIIEKMYGYASCGLPIVMEHNTPNNSLPLIWADTTDRDSTPKMRPLFRRRERHSDIEKSEGTEINHG